MKGLKILNGRFIFERVNLVGRDITVLRTTCLVPFVTPAENLCRHVVPLLSHLHCPFSYPLSCCWPPNQNTSSPVLFLPFKNCGIFHKGYFFHFVTPAENLCRHVVPLLSHLHCPFSYPLSCCWPPNPNTFLPVLFFIHVKIVSFATKLSWPLADSDPT